MDIAITKMSSKGQIVIPAEMRGDMHEGDKLVVIKAGNQLILKSISEFGKKLEEDLEFAKRTEKAWKEYDQGKSKSMSFDEFLKKAKKW
ncbi:MAG: AbrB/MazE/SpoVT family DNA-binding domain-containing protein [archaeon]